MSNSNNLFYRICSKVNNKVYLEEIMARQHALFDIQPFKIDKLYAEKAKKIYNQIRAKYQVSKEYQLNPTFWYQNQRKLFIWFIVCYFHQQQIIEIPQPTLDWQQLSRTFFYKNIEFLKFQYQNIVKQKNRVSWTENQDNILLQAAELQGPGNWNQISKHIYFTSNGKLFKSPKHCRQRWLNHLDQTKIKGKWTDEEDYKILTFVKQNGKKWSRVAQVLKFTRTEHMVKNRFNSLMSKLRKSKKQKEIDIINKIINALAESIGIQIKMEEKVVKSCGLIQTCESNLLRCEKLQNKIQRTQMKLKAKSKIEIEEERKGEEDLEGINLEQMGNRENGTLEAEFNPIMYQRNQFQLQFSPSIFFLYNYPYVQQETIYSQMGNYWMSNSQMYFNIQNSMGRQVVYMFDNNYN